MHSKSQGEIYPLGVQLNHLLWFLVIRMATLEKMLAGNSDNQILKVSKLTFFVLFCFSAH